MSTMFYCVKGLGDDNKQLNFYRPFRISESYSPYFNSEGDFCRGHESIEKLKSDCHIWNTYRKEDPISAHKICEEKFILGKAIGKILVPMDPEFNRVSYKLIKHTVFGELNKNIQGIHLRSPLNRRIKSFLVKKRADANGVWIGDIEYYSEVRNKIYIKENSSMFPIDWTPDIFALKIYFAFKRMTQCKDNIKIFHSETDCGIRVEFIIVNGEMRSVYPIYEGEDG